MRRLFLAAACVAVLLCAAPAALAVTAQTPASVPSGTGVVNLTVLQFGGQPQADASGLCIVNEYAAGWYPGNLDYAPADQFGHITFTEVPAATYPNVDAHIVVRTAAAPEDYYKLDQMSWPAEGYTATLQPGHLPLTINRDESLGSGWASWASVEVLLWTGPTKPDQGEGHLALTHINGKRSDPFVTGDANTLALGPETLSGGWLKFSQDQGLVLNDVVGRNVSPGSTMAPLTIDQAQAQRVEMRGFGSGKPGARAQVHLDNYPAGATNDIFGEPDYPKSAQVKVGNATGAGWVSITIPKNVVPGYKYWISMVRTDVPSRNRTEFFLVTSFQTCTLKPSKTAVLRGRTVALSGVVPVAGHRGSTAGTPKPVVIYRTTSSKVAAKGQPTVGGGGTVAGWTKIASAKADGFGKYRKGSIKVRRTTWYCAWYGRDAEYSGGWTTPAKVKAR